MTVKIEESGRRSVQVEVEVPGTPEEVWEAIASGPGVSAWFVPTKIDGRVGGTIALEFGPGMEATAEILEWDPPRYLSAIGPPQAPGAPPFATEWFVEARSGGVAVVRVVHSLFADTDEWDGQITGTESGWPAYFRVLRLYLEHFSGQGSACIQPMAMTTESAESAWAKATEALGLGGAVVGERCETSGSAPRLGGTVEFASDGGKYELVIRTDAPAPGVAQLLAMGCAEMGPGMTLVMMRLFLYGDGADEAIAGPAGEWKAAIAGLFPPPAPPTEHHE